MKNMSKVGILGLLVCYLFISMIFDVEAKSKINPECKIECNDNKKKYYHSITVTSGSVSHQEIHSISFYTCDDWYSFSFVFKVPQGQKYRITKDECANVEKSSLKAGIYYGDEKWSIALSQKLISETLNMDETHNNIYVECNSDETKCAAAYDEEDFKNSFNQDDVGYYKKFNIYSGGKNNHDSGIKGDSDPDDVEVEEYNPVKLPDLEEAKCSTLLGDKNDPMDPAYYIKLAFDLIKYSAIIILIVFSVIDFFKAVVSKDEDALKKATSNVIKRLIILLILFILPTLILYLFELSGIMDNPELCGI